LVNLLQHSINCAPRHLPAHVQPDAQPMTVASGPLTCATAPWPEIDGIDAADASDRLSGDSVLLLVMLKRLLSEFSDVTLPAGADALVLALHGARMHKLRGGAGLLGAKVISQLASEAETACGEGGVGRAAQLTTELATRLEALAESAAPALNNMVTAADDAVVASADEADPQVVVDLVELLRQHDLSSLDYVHTVSPQLRRLLGKQSYVAVRHHIDNLQFNDASRMLDDWSASAAPAIAAACMLAAKVQPPDAECMQAFGGQVVRTSPT
jgi:HPt (histidine-containing phosphotransfer) domain-containing protein